MTEPVAIVGMDVLLPGAGSLKHYWRNLADGVDAITEAPPHRVEPEFYDPSQRDKPNRIYCYRGGFVDQHAHFDPLRYGVMPASVDSTEPEQLIALRVAHGAIEDAGGMDRLPDRERVGVILGRLGQSSMAHMKFYARVRLADHVCKLLSELLPDVPEEKFDLVREKINENLGPHRPESVIGLMPNLTASRIANRLDLRGPAYTIDAACASSLIAVDQGIAELASGRLDMVLAGGVHHNHDAAFWSVFTQLRALSVRGEIRPLDAGADGLLIGEGTGVVVLKRLADAIRDGDRIHAVIRGIGTSSDGRSASLVNPESSGQVVAVRRAWASAGLDPAAPDALGLLEAHGTATPVGDATELATMAEVFGPPTGGSPPVIGSVKSMIGHAMPAAGVAGLVKAVFAVSKGVLLPTLHCDNPRPELARTRFEPIAAMRPWDQPGPRRAAVNAFGFGGINAHVIIEQAPDRPRPRHPGRETGPPKARAQVREPDQIVLLPASDQAALAQLLDAEDHVIRARGAAQAQAAQNRAAQGQPGREPGCRLGLVDPTPQRLAAARKVVAAGQAWRGGRDIWFSPRPMLAGGQGKIAFVFPGLEATLSHTVDEVASHFGLADAAVDSGDDFSRRFIDVIRVGWLLNDALTRMGITPDMVAGHSVGEWTAGLIAGLADETMLGEYAGALFNPAYHREDLVHAVIGAGADSLAATLAAYPGVHLAIDNTPVQSVVCGPAGEMTRLIEELGRKSTMCQLLPFATGIHTPYLAPYLDVLRPLVEVQKAPQEWVQVWSGVIAAPLPADVPQRRELFLRQLVEPIRFRSMVTAMHDAGVRAFLQVGPGQLCSLIQDNLRGRDHLAIPVNVDFRGGLAQLRRVATGLWAEGYAPDLSVLEPAGTASTGAAGLPGAAAQDPEVPAPATQKPARSSGSTRSLTVLLDLGSRPMTLGKDAASLLGARPMAAAAASPASIPAATASARPAPASVPAGLGSPGQPSALRPAATAARPAGRPAVTHPSLEPVRPGSPPRSGTPVSSGGREPARAPASVAVPPARRPTAAVPGPSGDGADGWKSVLRISLATMPYVADHVFFPQPDDWPHMADRMPVVPATTIIQHMIDAVQTAVPGTRVVQVADAGFTRWVAADPGQDVEITVRPAGPGVFTVAFGGYARATMRTAAAYPADPPPQWQHDPATERPSPLGVERMYEERILFHGPRYRGVLKVHAIGEHHIRALLRTPAPPGGLLDAALQLLGSWADVSLPVRFVIFPTGFDSIQFFGPPPAPGELVECVGRFPLIEDRKVVGDFQLIRGGRIWAQATGAAHKRFDSHPKARPAELAPGRLAFGDLQPEGWVSIFDYWPYPESANSATVLTMGFAGFFEFQRQQVADRKGWLLGRLAAKDAARFLMWDEDGTREVFPIEIRLASGPDGRGRVEEWPERKIPAFDVSFASAGKAGVAIARPAEPPGALGLGIGIAEIPGEGKKAVPTDGLSSQELAVLDAASAAAPGSRRDLWVCRLLAARQAAAEAEGTGLSQPQRLLTVTAATSRVITVATSGRTYRIPHRELRDGDKVTPRSYVVAWTRGPENGEAPVAGGAGTGAS